MKTQILTPVGRLVQGSLYEAQTKDMDGRPMLDKSGNPTQKYFFALAIEKIPGKHWSETTWGEKIYNEGLRGFSKEKISASDFAWKISDGDDATPPREETGKRNCDKEGFKGHWVIRFQSQYKPKIVTETGDAYILEENYVKRGDYVQVSGSVEANKSAKKPGVFMNHSMVAFVRRGQPILTGVDPKTVGFGKDTVIPKGALDTPVSSGFTPPPLPPQPHVNILKKIMLPKAGDQTYEDLISMGWTDQQLVQHGYMQEI